MKKTLMMGAVAALALTATIGGVAIAQNATPPAPPAPRHARLDTDGDTRISQAEFVQARVTRLSAADTNRDGTVTPEERQATMTARRAEHVAMRFDRLDADKNGAISRAEFEARPDRVARGPGHRRDKAPHRGGPRAERMAGRPEAKGPVVIADVQAKAGEAFTRLDADHDGYLTATEMRAGRQQMREGRQDRRAERVARRSGAGMPTPPSPPAPASE